MSIEIKGRVKAYPVPDGLQLDFMQYPEKSDMSIMEDWYGNYMNLLFTIYNKFGTKPIIITIDKAVE